MQFQFWFLKIWEKPNGLVSGLAKSASNQTKPNFPNTKMYQQTNIVTVILSSIWIIPSQSNLLTKIQLSTKSFLTLVQPTSFLLYPPFFTKISRVQPLFPQSMIGLTFINSLWLNHLTIHILASTGRQIEFKHCLLLRQMVELHKNQLILIPHSLLKILRYINLKEGLQVSFFFKKYIYFNLLPLAGLRVAQVHLFLTFHHILVHSSTRWHI